MGGAPPFLVDVDLKKELVQAWSVARLPFEPKGWLVDLRSELRSALKQLQLRNGAMLGALYGSPVRDYCDAENILIYNVGAGHMAAAAASGIRVERMYDALASARPLASNPNHYWRYGAIEAGRPFAAWDEGATLAEWSCVPMPALTEFAKPSSIWCAMRVADVQVAKTADLPRPFGLRLVLGAPPNRPVSPAKAVKPLLDGLIAGLHSHDGSALADVSERLHVQLPDETPEHIGRLLVDSSAAPLGRRRLVWPRAKSVQWNPADDLCLAFELRVAPSDRFELSGRLVEIDDRPRRGT